MPLPAPAAGYSTSPAGGRPSIGSSASNAYSISRSRSSSSSVGCGGAGGGGGSSAGIRTWRYHSKPVPAGNQPAHRHVLLQAAQVVDLAGDRRLGEHARRLLERRRRDERVGRERRLGDAEQQRLRRRRTAARADHPLVLLEEPELVRLLVDQELGVADILDLAPTASSAAR